MSFEEFNVLQIVFEFGQSRGNRRQYRRLLDFFFQAEDGIRDGRVTGVQTCALPISPSRLESEDRSALLDLGHELSYAPRTVLLHQSEPSSHVLFVTHGWTKVTAAASRSEERRVGKECGYWGCAKPCRELGAPPHRLR